METVIEQNLSWWKQSIWILCLSDVISPFCSNNNMMKYLFNTFKRSHLIMSCNEPQKTTNLYNCYYLKTWERNTYNVGFFFFNWGQPICGVIKSRVLPQQVKVRCDICLILHVYGSCSPRLPVWHDSQDVWRSDSVADTQLVLLPSLVKPGWLVCLSSASPTNQELIEAARSSCCYSNRQHWLTPLENMFFLASP